MPIFDSYHGVKPRFLSPSAFPDGAGNVFLAVVFNQGSDEDTWVRIYKRTPQGVKSTVAEYRSIAGKEDGVCIYQSGADLHGFVTAHPSDPDTNIQDIPPIRGVCVPYPIGQMPMGAWGAFIPTDTGGGTGVTAEQIEAIIAGVRARLLPDIQRIVDNIKPKTKAAITELNMHSGSMQDRGVDQWARDRVYEVLRDNGLLNNTEADE